MNWKTHQRILEINGGEKISQPIVKFPPFKLRAAMVEKDPVIWLHLLETYNRFFSYLMSEGRLEQLDDSTYENLCIFVRGYLKELSDEEGKLLSLGMNKDVEQQLHTLRSWILALAKECGLLHLQVSCDTLWDFVRLYVTYNPETVRSLIDGSLKPKINTQKAHLNRTYQLHQHLKQLIESNKFTRVDLKALESLLSAEDRRSPHFADQFLNAKWAAILESWFLQESKDIRIIATNLGILTYTSATENRIIELISEMRITLETLQQYPLLASLLMNDNFRAHFKGLASRLPLMRSLVGSKIVTENQPALSTEAVEMIIEVFPFLTVSQAEKQLQLYDGNVERTIESLFESPLPPPDESSATTATHSAAVNGNEQLKPAEYESELKQTDRLSKEELDQRGENVPDALRNKTLARALALLYQADEDEMDDTYNEADSQPLADGDEGDKGAKAYENREGYLWELLKVNKTLFERQSRGTKGRKDMKSMTSWSDEQIEGWARMLERSPKRAQLLEERYMFRGNARTGKRAFVQNKHNSLQGPQLDDTREGIRNEKQSTNKTSVTGGGDKRRQNARKEKNKSTRANHNRKSGHDKKIARVLP
ncbi:LADA_0A03026g1_1 [Lachancea dasiensis]|uniref:LADA_0A03026g1_1 n=1 Tax=Lachancea dasiensis TaxID=1072105 RepID=A0A1G4IMR9_9SACH|nr:LADA_0A03026g1_1 [Lachancea dasiensis]